MGSLLTGSEKPLTTAEARLQVESEMAAEIARKEEQRSDLLAIPAKSERAKSLPEGGTLLLRRISPPPPTPIHEYAEPLPRKWTKAEIAEFLILEAEHKPPKNISVSITVYDDEVSEIRLWHEGEAYSVLSNVAFSHLQGLGGFEDDRAEWSLFAMVGEVQEEREKQIAEEAKRFGAEYEPRKRPDMSVFTSLDEPEYLVFPTENQTVPDEVLAKLDALHTYYLSNEKELAAERQRREALAEARRSYREKNPPEPEDIVINFWRE